MRGDPALLSPLLQYPGALLVDQPPNDFIALPNQRLAYLTLEALARAEGVTEDYRFARQHYFSSFYESLAKSTVGWQLLQNLRLARPLLPHQAQFVAWAYPNRGVFNASEQGTGKTATAWVLAHLWQSRRILIVCPHSLIPEWQREYQQLFFLQPHQRQHRYADDQNSIPEKLTHISLFQLEKRVSTRSAQLTTIGTCFQDDLTHPDSRPGAAAVAINYEVLCDLEDTIRHQFRPDLVIFDESWRTKSPKAQVTKAAVRISKRARNVLALTGTPIGNHVGDFFPQLCLLNSGFIDGQTLRQGYDIFLDQFSEWEDVRFRVGEGESAHVRLTRRPVGLRDPYGLMRLLDTFWYRATKATCLSLPPKRHRTVRLTLPPDTLTLYRAVERDGEAALGATLSLNDDRVVATRLQQLADGLRPTPSAVTAQTRELSENAVEHQSPVDSSLIHPDQLPNAPVSLLYNWLIEPITPNPKLDWLTSWANDELLGDPGRRAIVWVRFNPLGYLITAALQAILGANRVVFAYGDTKTPTLEEWKASFNSRHPDGVQVIVAQWKKLAYGHNLQAADQHVRVSHTWSYVEYVQAEDRSDRIGRTSSVEYISLVMAGTKDEDIQAAMERKQDLAFRTAPDTVGAP